MVLIENLDPHSKLVKINHKYVLQIRSSIMSCIYQRRMHVDSSKGAIQFFKNLENKLNDVDELLEELEAMEKDSMKQMVERNIEIKPICKLFSNYRTTLNLFSVKVREVLDAKTNPRSLLELSTSAVSSYRLPTNELPIELQYYLQEGSVQMQNRKLKEEEDYLTREAPKMLSDLGFLLEAFIEFEPE